MNFVQLLKFAVGGLWRQKVRTALTLVGVTVGTCALAFSLALGLGLREFIETEFKGRDDFWRVSVRVDEPPPDETTVPSDKIAVKGQMTDERRGRIREMLLEKYQNNRLRKPLKVLAPEALDAIAHLPGVAEIRTYTIGNGRLWVDGADKSAPALSVSGAARRPGPAAHRRPVARFARRGRNRRFRVRALPDRHPRRRRTGCRSGPPGEARSGRGAERATAGTGPRASGSCAACPRN